MKRQADRLSNGLASALLRTIALLTVLLISAAPRAVSGESGATSSPKQSQATPAESKQPSTSAERSAQELFRGKVVLLREALARHKVDAKEEFDKQVVLETPSGDLIPIVPDWRGRAFYQDERLRNRDVELVGKRKPGVPYLQVLIVFTFDEKGKRQYTDYYCDTCAFPMYEIKPCECCHGPIRLRYQPRDLPDYIKTKLSDAGRPVHQP